ncbi:conserved phage C-terminal domain-containing protein [Sporosarcina sp. FSL W7-1283]|uniref:conserved phage C-terminal domain-containing protein n=1 Tax=Sporosarcina sp. FSL W7-1283 TaxID=2921560 RepID=UPI0030FBBA42
MKLLINEPSLQLLPTLVHQVGLNEAIFLQQLHYRSLISKDICGGEKWVYKTYEDWGKEFAFWSQNTIKRTIGRLEKKGYLISTAEYNERKNDQTKRYRINYSKLDISAEPGWVDGHNQDEPEELPTLGQPLFKELKEPQKENVGFRENEVVSITEYLNQVTGKRYKANAASTKRLLTARLNEGYTVDDFKRVIDLKASQWLQDEKFRNYLRPSTLFNATNFENYFNEEMPAQRKTEPFLSFELDFAKGER